MSGAMELTRPCGEPAVAPRSPTAGASVAWRLPVEGCGPARGATGEAVRGAGERQPAFYTYMNTSEQHLENCLRKNKQIFIYKFCGLVFIAFL